MFMLALYLQYVVTSVLLAPMSIILRGKVYAATMTTSL